MLSIISYIGEIPPTEIDTLYYIMIFALGGVLTFAGAKSSIGLLNIIAMPVWLFLALEFKDKPLLLITMIGLTILQIILIVKPNKKGY